MSYDYDYDYDLIQGKGDACKPAQYICRILGQKDKVSTERQATRGTICNKTHYDTEYTSI